MQDVANMLGVSKVTVSKALRDNKDISESMREKVKEAADKAGYVYNIAGKMLRDNMTYSIGIVTSERYFGQDDFFYIDLYKLLSGGIEKMRYTSMFNILDTDSEKSLWFPNMISEKKVDGVIVLGQFSKEYLRRLLEFQIPTVFLDFYYDRLGVDSVNTDNFFGAYEITNMLIERGHRKIAFVGNLNLTSSIQDRYLGYCKSMLEYKLPVKPEWLLSDRTDESEWVDIVLPDEMPTAFVCNCDKTAQKLIGTLLEKGYNVPGDCSVVGFDDSIHAVNIEPHISTVRVNLEQMAKMAIKILTKKIKDKSVTYGRVLINGNIILRDSIGEAKSV
jgi:LacI family transcriptional regulator